MPTPIAQAWTCPACGNFYRIPLGRRAPVLCPACQAERDEAAEAPPQPTEFDQLSAVVEENESPAADAAPPPPDGEFDDSQVASFPKRQKANTLQRIVLVMGSAIVVLGAWGVYGVWKQYERSTPGDAAVWTQAKLEVTDRLRAPKTAEFPKPGEIKRLRGSVPPRWSVKSVVDAKNEHGVPIRHQWSMEISFDTRTRKWKPDYIEIDDQRVYASEATQREDREYAEKRDAKTKAAKKELARSKAKKRAAAAALEGAAGGRSGDSTKGSAGKTESNPAQSVDARRETGIWNEVVRFEGQASHQTAPFKVNFKGWRFSWECEGETTIRLLDATKKPVDDEIDIGGGGEKGKRYVPRGTGEFSLQITTRSHWTIVVEE